MRIPVVGPSRIPGSQDPEWGGRGGAGQAQTRAGRGLGEAGVSATPTCELHKHPMSALILARPAVRAAPGRLSPVPCPVNHGRGFSSPLSSLLSPGVLFKAKLDLALAWRFPGVASCVGVRVQGLWGARGCWPEAAGPQAAGRQWQQQLSTPEATNVHFPPDRPSQPSRE